VSKRKPQRTRRKARSSQRHSVSSVCDWRKAHRWDRFNG